MANKRKIDAMHLYFGVLPDNRCEDCDNLIQGDYHGMHLRKCTVYGATHSEATDWRKKYIACGLYNKEYNGRPVFIKTSGDTYGWLWHRQQTVIGEFVCDEIIDLWPGYAKGDDCLTYDEQEAYLGECGHGYGWHISNLVIYDEPKDLRAFHYYEHSGMVRWVSHPPMSWCYVEEL